MAPAEPSLYDVLGVDRRASLAEIRKAYLRQARRYHPDFHTNDLAPARETNEREMRRINEAWEVLGDAVRRRAYDERWQQDQRAEQRSNHRPGAASYDFRPLDDGPDVDYSALLDDTPVEGTSVSRAAQVVPAVLLLGGSAVFAVGAVVQLPLLVALGILLAVLGVIGFVVIPALAIARSMQAERDR